MNQNPSVLVLTRTAFLAVCISTLSISALATTTFQDSPKTSTLAAGVPRSTNQALPPALRPVFYGSLVKDAGAAYRVRKNGCVILPKSGLKGCFNRDGAHFTGAAVLTLHLVAYGRFSAGQAGNGEIVATQAVKPIIKNNQIRYIHDNLTEWWRVLPVGFEQGFTIEKRLGGNGKLTLALAANDKADRQGDALAWGKLRYGDLVVTDANGKVIPATLKIKSNRILIAVNDEHAAYPLTIDPLVWIEQEVTASDGAGYDHFGFSVALAGTTALIGAWNNNNSQGAVYVFTESNGVWAQVQKLTMNGTVDFGWGVALEGTTALITAPLTTVNGHIQQGAVYEFVKSNGTWAKTQEFTASDGAAYGTFGMGVALSGNVAFISAGGNGRIGDPTVPGSVYVFNQSNSVWTQTQEFPSPNQPGDDFGWWGTIDISGITAVVGARNATVKGNLHEGNVTVYTESNGTWTPTQQLTGSDSGMNSVFGSGVAIQGNTMLIGAVGGAAGVTGAAYVFTNAGGTWTQAQKLVPSDSQSGDSFGSFTALDGTTALIGASGYNSLEGKAYVFTSSNGTWSQTQELIPSDNPSTAIFGFAGALSMPTALIGANGVTVNGNFLQGAAYFYGQSDLGLAVNAPQTVGQDQQYVSQTIATNNASATSPAVAVTVAVPAAASFVSANATQGSCSEDSDVVTCNFGQIYGNAGTATANVTLKATGNTGETIENTASVAKATPALSASAPTEITSPESCPAGYTEFSGHLDAGGTFTSSPIEVTEAGQKYVDLTSPASFGFFAIVNTRYGQHTYVYPHAKHGHRWGAAGSYQVGVQAGPDAGGDYTLCVNLNPTQ